eukprot:3786633-Alexandrium_andersonii.AAC.1
MSCTHVQNQQRPPLDVCMHGPHCDSVRSVLTCVAKNLGKSKSLGQNQDPGSGRSPAPLNGARKVSRLLGNGNGPAARAGAMVGACLRGIWR